MDDPTPDVYGELLLPTRASDGTASVRPWVALSMVSSVDGGAVLDGTTRRLGGPADHVAFHRLRDACDAILVGAGTVRIERYRPPVGDEQRRVARAGRGLAPVPRLVVVSGSLDLPADHPMLADPQHRPVVVTHEASSAALRDRLAAQADLLVVGEREVDLAAMLHLLGDQGLHRVLCEGGPSLNSGLLAGDLVDEVFLTLAPTLLGGDAPRIVQGEHPGVDHPMDLLGVVRHRDELLLRYRRRTSTVAPTARG